MTAIAATSPACPRCGRALPADAPAGLCPRCLLSDGFGGQSEADYRVRTGDGRRFVPPTVDELAAEFPNLEFVRPLGSGGMGAVYLAKQIRLDRPIAVKVLPPDLADDGAFAERFLREARALARLSHPNIVSVFDFGQTPGGLYFFLMEYIEGPTLRQVVASRTTDPKQALEIVRQVCDALQYAHDKGVVHRDIKPENILLDGHGRVKIADFGLAKLLGLADAPAGSPAAGSLTHTQQAMGTPHYMAPEQIVGSRAVDHRADIYSLGVVFYELLTGDLPLGRFAPPSRKVRIDVRLDEVVLRSLESEPALRYQHASDIRTAVDTIESGPVRGTAAGAAAMRFAREAATEVGRAVGTIAGGPGAVPMSRYVGPAWVCFVLAAASLFAVLTAGLFAGRVEAAAVTLVAVGWLGIPAMIAATPLGFSAAREVAATDGRVTGLVAGLGAALPLPVLLVSVVLWLVCLIPGESFAEGVLGTYEDGVVPVCATLFAVPLWVAAGWLIARAAWRRATRGMSPDLIRREVAAVPAPLRAGAEAVGRAFARCGNLFGGTAREPEAATTGDADPAAMPTPPEWYPTRGRFLGKSLAIVGMLLLVAAFVGVQMLRRGTSPHATVVTPPVPVSPPPGGYPVSEAGMSGMYGMEGGDMGMADPALIPFDSNVRWYVGPDGPQLNSAWVAATLGIDARTQEQVDAVLRDVHAEYERALDAHTSVAFEGRTAVFTVTAFPEEYDWIADEFWTRVDAILNREQQAVMRYNFPLRYDARQSTLVGRYEDKLMPLGDDTDSSGRDRSVISIGRSGQWYEWSIALPDLGTSGETPELPRWLGRWQERYEVLSSLRRSGAAFDLKRPPLVARKPWKRAEAMPAGMDGMMGSGMMMEGSMMGEPVMGGPAY